MPGIFGRLLKKLPPLLWSRGGWSSNLSRGQPGTTMVPTGNPAIPFFPDPSCFYHQNMDIVAGNATLPPPGPIRYSGIPILIASAFSEGHRPKVNAKDAYTHIILTDPQLLVVDAYSSQGRAMNQDALAIPAGQTNNYWFAVFSMVLLLPVFGKKQVVLADRFGTPGSWTTLL